MQKVTYKIWVIAESNINITENSYISQHKNYHKIPYINI